MSTPVPLAAPIRALACPLCGEANHCAPAAEGSFAAPCWCREVTVPAEVLARVPAAHRGRACLCRACAGAAPESLTP